MPKTKYLSTHVKLAIVASKELDKTDRDVAKLFNVNQSTVSRVYNRYKKTNAVHRKPKSGRPRKTTEGHDKSIIDLVECDPNKTATDVTDHAFRRFGLTISQSTASRILKRYKLFARRPASKSMLKECHRRQRLAFALAHWHWTAADWGRVLFTDETKFNRFNPDGGVYVRRPPNERYNPKYTRKTVKYGAGSIMAWGQAFLEF